jgi:ribosomal protein S18 acetylase RimI-like enzyme
MTCSKNYTTGDTDMSLLIREVPVEDTPLDLLLLADPSEANVRSYLAQSRCFAASENGAVVGACAVQPLDSGGQELMCIAVHPDRQKSGIGTALLKWVIDFYRKSGAGRLEVGTGTFGYQLAFYQRQGFRVTAIDRNFFIHNYPEPIFEDGIQLFDMLRLTLDFSGKSR